jgi:hypothetical protein
MDDDFLGTILGWVVIGGFFLVVVGWNDAGWVGTARYAISYKVPPSQVQFSPKPYDCDWWSAPLGAKHCSYEPVVTPYNAAGQTVIADAKYIRNTETGELWVSYDGGPLMALPPGEIPDRKVKGVKIDWTKVAD